MRKNKFSAAVIITLALALGVATLSWAGMGMGMGGGCGMMGGANLTPEQSSALFDLKQKAMNETAGLRKQMFIKRGEMAALWKAENPDQNQIQAKQQEINAIRDQLQQKMTAFRLEAKKIAPDANFGMGMGKGRGCGPGMGQGPGMCAVPPAAPAK